MALQIFNEIGKPFGFKSVLASEAFPRFLNNYETITNLPNNFEVIGGVDVSVDVVKGNDNRNALLSKGFTAVSYHSRPIENTQDDGYTAQNITENTYDSFLLEGDPINSNVSSWTTSACTNLSVRLLLWDGEIHILNWPYFSSSWTTGHYNAYYQCSTLQRSIVNGGLGIWSSPYYNYTSALLTNISNSNLHYTTGNEFGGVSFEHPLYNTIGDGGTNSNKAGNLSTFIAYENSDAGCALGYSLVQGLEVAEVQKIKYNNLSLKNLISIWDTEESLNVYNPVNNLNGKLRFQLPSNVEFLYNNQRKFANIKPIANISYLFSSTLFSLLGNGIYLFSHPVVKYSKDPQYFKTTTVQGRTALDYSIVNFIKNLQVYNNRAIEYVSKYRGGLDYIYLALWKLSRPECLQILNDNTSWEKPDVVFNSTLRTSTKLLPAESNADRAPIVRLKRNSSGNKALIIAWNPGSDFKSTITVNLPNGHSTSIKLINSWAKIGIVTI